MMLSVLMISAQLAAVPPGQPPARLRFVHLDRAAAVYVDDAATAPDPDRPGMTRTRSLSVPFVTRYPPYWITERHDCAARRTQAVWREGAIPELNDGPRDIPGSPQDWDSAPDAAGPAVGMAVCGATPTTSGTPMTPDEAISHAYDQQLETRFQPDVYTRYGDLGETLEFLGLDHRSIGWFVEPRSARPDPNGATIDALAINGRSATDAERLVWFRLHFDCQNQMLTLKGQRYAEGPRALDTVTPETTPTRIEPNSMMSRVQQYACTPDNPPEVQVVNGLDSAIAGIVAHVGATDAARSD